jgi:hypothetical protein
MTPASVRQLQQLRRQLFNPPIIEVTTDTNMTVTPAA